MNFSKPNQELPGFQITPMLDVVFLLLTFFVTTSIFSQWENEIDIQLPTAETGVIPDRLPGEIIINLNSKGEITVNQNALTPEELLAKCQRLSELFPGQPVVVRSDKSTEYRHIVMVLDTCSKAGISNISFATAMTDDAADEGSDLPPATVTTSQPQQ